MQVVRDKPTRFNVQLNQSAAVLQAAAHFSMSLTHLLSQSLRLVLVGRQLLLPLFHVSVGLVQGGHQLGVAVLQSEEFRLQVELTDGPERDALPKTKFNVEVS